jgi:hypothetical protein
LRELAPIRVRWRARAAQLVATAQTACVAAGDRACHDRAIARQWELGSHDKVAQFFSPTSGKAIAFGDVLALPRALTRGILTRALASLDEDTIAESVERLAFKLARDMGALMDDLAHDRHVGLADAFARIAAIAMRGHLAAVRKAEAAEGVR